MLHFGIFPKYVLIKKAYKVVFGFGETAKFSRDFGEILSLSIRQSCCRPTRTPSEASSTWQKSASASGETDLPDHLLQLTKTELSVRISWSGLYPPTPGAATPSTLSAGWGRTSGTPWTWWEKEKKQRFPRFSLKTRTDFVQRPAALITN